jgi:4-amino-4-deoxy-L-arabinose transferase-like glycosyltransferase
MYRLAQLRDKIEHASVARLIMILLVVQTLMHVRYVSLPPMGFHEWRQTHTLSVARNFYEEEMNILHPRVDYRGSSNGITGMEFPIVNYIIAVGYSLFGLHDAVGRIVLLLSSFVALVAAFRFGRVFFESQFFGFILALFLTFSPLFGYYSFVVLPDVPSLAMMFISLYYLALWNKTNDVTEFLLACVTLMFALLIKVSAMIVFPLWIYLFASKWKSLPKKTLVKHFVQFVISMVVVSTWYLYARHLSAMNENFDFKLSTSFPYPLDIVPRVSKKVLVQWLPELYINYAEFVFFAAGIVVLARTRDLPLKRFGFWFGVGVVAYMCAFLPMLEMHDYYMVSSIQFLIIVSVIGFRAIWEKALASKRVAAGLIVLCVLIPILGSVRALTRFESAQMAPEFWTIEQHVGRIIQSKSDLVIAASDDSPSIYLYRLHVKGWTATDSIPTEKFRAMVRSGARYLISDSRSLEERLEIRKYLKTMSEFGRFRIFELHDTN